MAKLFVMKKYLKYILDLGSFFKKLHRRMIKGYTIMVIPNSPNQVKNWRIPFALCLVIFGIIIFNIYIFLGYTAQIWHISSLNRKILGQDWKIAKLRSEKQRFPSVLEYGQRLETEWKKIKDSRSRLLKTWKDVQRKDGKVYIASRGGFKNAEQFQMVPINKPKGAYTRLEELEHSLAQLDFFIKEETEVQSQLLTELLSYEHLLDHTPTLWPVYGAIICRFGMRFHPVWHRYQPHLGVDLQAPSRTKIRAAADGVVSFAGWEGGYGYLIKINHGYGYETRYAHNSRLLVFGGSVRKGQLISLAGSTGVATGPHLHYEVRINGRPVNPVAYLKK